MKILYCKIITNASQNKIVYLDNRHSSPQETRPLDAKIYLTASPTQGKANKMLIQFLASELQVYKHQITIIHGTLSNQKTIKIDE